MYTTIDMADFAALHKYHWSLRRSHSCWYAIRKETVRGCKRTVFMHRQITGAAPDQIVHHKNRNTLDNRRDNLVIMTHLEHNWLHLDLRVQHSSPKEHAACTQFLARRGTTALVPCGPFHG
jgi:hypothetical protein